MKLHKKTGWAALAACAVLLLMLLSGCGARKEDISSSAESAHAPALEIVCTMFPQYDMLRAIGGERVRLTLMVQPGMEAHGFAPTVQDMAAAEKADLLVLTGGDADAWAESILENISLDKTQAVSLVSCLGENAVYADEHIFTSPRKCLAAIDGLSDLLCKADPDGEEIYRAGAATYRARFEALDEGFSSLAQTAKKPVILGDRQPFACLAEDYGLNFIGAFSGCSTDTEVSAETMARLTDTAIREEVPAVFHLELSEPALCRTLAEASGAQIRMLYSGQEISRADFDAGLTLADMLAYDLAQITEAQI
jgi:zinc transport system substrate-binding protein